MLTNRHTFNGLFSRTTWVSEHQKCKTSLDFNEARDDGGGSGISWTICKSLARQITTPSPHQSTDHRPDALPDNQPTVSNNNNNNNNEHICIAQNKNPQMR